MNEARLMEFVGKSVTDLGALVNGSLIVIGDKLGLYKAMAGQGSMTSTELARRTGHAERYLREWLSAQAAADIWSTRAAVKTTVTDSACRTSTPSR